MNAQYNLYKKSPKYPSETVHTVLLKQMDSKEDCLDVAMMDIFNELHDGDGENGGEGSLWRCARGIYDCLANGEHFFYADCEWWIDGIPRKPVEKTWVFRFSAVFDTSFTVTDTSYENAKKRAQEMVGASSAELKDYIGKSGLFGWEYDGNWGDEGEGTLN